MKQLVALLAVRSRAEWIMASGVIAGLIYCAAYLYQNNYLPPPFFYEPDDTFADWFNTAFWARQPGSYDTWKTVYPPLSFVLIRFLGIDSCYPDRRSYDFSAGLAARSCDWLGVVMIFAIFFLNLWLVWRVYRKNDRATAIPRTICLGLGMPMAYALERGNLVMLSFTFLVLGVAPLLRSARLKWLAVGLAVNLKVYLIVAPAMLILKRRWRWAECALLSVVLVYMASYAILGRGTPAEIFENIRDFAQLPSGQVLDQWYTTTYQPILKLINEGTFPLAGLIGSRNVDLAQFILPLLVLSAQGGIVMALAATAIRPEVVPTYRVVTLGILLALITTEPGGYTMMYFMLFVLLEPWRGVARRWAITMCYILAVPLDIVIDKTFPMPRETYFGGGTSTMINYYVTLGPFIRPLLIMTIAYALSALTVVTVWKDVRADGWSRRWRFRRDAPLLPMVARPAPPRNGA